MPLSVWVVIFLMMALFALLTATSLYMAKDDHLKLMIVLSLLSAISATIFLTKVLG